jgi:hypothetical protein
MSDRECPCGCHRSLRGRNANAVYFSKKCKKKAYAARWLLKRPRRGAETAPVPQERFLHGVGVQKIVKIASMAQGMEILARDRPQFFLRLAASVEAQKREAAD